MNAMQRIVLVLGILAFVVMGFFPPWNLETGSGSTVRTYEGNLFNPPKFPGHSTPSLEAIDHGMLLFQWFLVAAATVGLYWAFRSTPGASISKGGRPAP
jgi:hypothetical protein